METLVMKPQLTDERNTFKPFKYPWAYDAWLQHEQSHWLHSEVPMGEDLKDYQKKLKKEEKEFLTKILRFFVQGDLDIGDGYYTHYLPVFKQPGGADDDEWFCRTRSFARRRLRSPD
jgi:ribonucleoside-diphosphate reductase beta chain